MHDADEYYAVYDERNVAARKEHRCCACREVIRPRERYYRIGIVFDGSARTLKRCVRCQRIHEHLREVAPGDGWPDEDLRCGHDYDEEFGATPDELAALAFALPGEVK